MYHLLKNLAIYSVLLLLLLAVLALLSLKVGVYESSFDDIFNALSGQHNDSFSLLIWELRLPRTLLAIIAGGALSICGLALQGLFRNPLADPALIGASGGAALGAVSAIVLINIVLPDFTSADAFYFLHRWGMTIMAFFGSLAAIFITYRLATRGRQTDISLLLLAGIAVQAISSAGFGLFVFLINEKELRNITFWTLGSVAYSNWQDVLISLCLGFLPALLLIRHSQALNVFTLGESDAFFSGIEVQKVKKWIILLVAISVASVTSLTGIIAFVGIIGPHLTKLLFGFDNKVSMPLSILVGSICVLAADILSRMVIPPAELPLGILTTALGGPLFLSLLLRLRRSGRL